VAILGKKDMLQMILAQNLVPVEFIVSGKTGGIFVPESSTEAEIKKAIKQWVKAYNGRWGGKFKKVERQVVIEMIKNTDFETMPQALKLVDEDGEVIDG
jgi:hypothetical protein